MDVPNKAQRQWECSQSFKTILHGCDVISHFPHVVIFRALLRLFHFIDQDIGQAGFRAFNARRQDRFAWDIGSDQEMGVGQMSA